MKRPVLTTILIASAAVLLPVLIVSSFAGMGVRKAAERRAGSSVVTVHPHEESVEAAATAGRTTVFLAGTIDMGSGEDWQARADSLFAALPDGDFLLFNPRQEHWDAERPGEMDYQVNWELDHLEKADWIIMNFLQAARPSRCSSSACMPVAAGSWSSALPDSTATTTYASPAADTACRCWTAWRMRCAT